MEMGGRAGLSVCAEKAADKIADGPDAGYEREDSASSAYYATGQSSR